MISIMHFSILTFAASLVCDMPDLAFTVGDEIPDVYRKSVDQAFIPDSIIPIGKCLRICMGTDAFLNSAVSGYIERSIVKNMPHIEGGLEDYARKKDMVYFDPYVTSSNFGQMGYAYYSETNRTVSTNGSIRLVYNKFGYLADLAKRIATADYDLLTTNDMPIAEYNFLKDMYSSELLKRFRIYFPEIEFCTPAEFSEKLSTNNLWTVTPKLNQLGITEYIAGDRYKRKPPLPSDNLALSWILDAMSVDDESHPGSPANLRDSESTNCLPITERDFLNGYCTTGYPSILLDSKRMTYDRINAAAWTIALHDTNMDYMPYGEITHGTNEIVRMHATCKSAQETSNLMVAWDKEKSRHILILGGGGSSTSYSSGEDVIGRYVSYNRLVFGGVNESKSNVGSPSGSVTWYFDFNADEVHEMTAGVEGHYRLHFTEYDDVDQSWKYSVTRMDDDNYSKSGALKASEIPSRMRNEYASTRFSVLTELTVTRPMKLNRPVKFEIPEPYYYFPEWMKESGYLKPTLKPVLYIAGNLISSTRKEEYIDIEDVNQTVYSPHNGKILYYLKAFDVENYADTSPIDNAADEFYVRFKALTVETLGTSLDNPELAKAMSSRVQKALSDNCKTDVFDIGIASPVSDIEFEYGGGGLVSVLFSGTVKGFEDETFDRLKNMSIEDCFNVTNNTFWATGGFSYIYQNTFNFKNLRILNEQ